MYDFDKSNGEQATPPTEENHHKSQRPAKPQQRRKSPREPKTATDLNDQEAAKVSNHYEVSRNQRERSSQENHYENERSSQAKRSTASKKRHSKQSDYDCKQGHQVSKKAKT
jgi:hypothetical protein